MEVQDHFDFHLVEAYTCLVGDAAMGHKYVSLWRFGLFLEEIYKNGGHHTIPRQNYPYAMVFQTFVSDTAHMRYRRMRRLPISITT